MLQTTKTLKPVMALVENYHLSRKQSLLASESRTENAESLQTANESSTEQFGDKVMSKIWVRMASIYGYKWTTHLGVASDAEGRLTESAKTWQKGLVGLTMDNLKAGFDALVLQNISWPPSLPEFRKLCLAKSGANAPSLDEVVSILAMASSRPGSLVARYRHPLALAISARVDVFGIRTAKTVDARRMVKPVYEALVQSGWEDWPDHAHEEQKALAVEIKRDRGMGMAAFSAIRGVL